MVAGDTEIRGSVSFVTTCCEDGPMHPSVREAQESDLDRIRQLIVDLATYERSAHEVKTTTEQLRAALFGPQPAA